MTTHVAGVTAGALAGAAADFRRAYEAAESTRERRNRLVLDALHAGWTHQEISDATGLSRGRISQIARGRER